MNRTLFSLLDVERMPVQDIDMRSDEVIDDHPEIHIECPEDQDAELEPLPDIYVRTSKAFTDGGPQWETYSPSLSPATSMMTLSSMDGDESDRGVRGQSASPWLYSSMFSRSAESVVSTGSICPSLLTSTGEGSREPSTDADPPMPTEQEDQPDNGVVIEERGRRCPSPVPVGLATQNKFLSVMPHFPRRRRTSVSSSNDEAASAGNSLTKEDMARLLQAAGELPVSESEDASIWERFKWSLSAANRKFEPQVQKKGACSNASMSRRKATAEWRCIVADCGQTFTRKFGLINHYRAHLKIKHLVCSHCGNTFRTSLRRHEKACERKTQTS